MQNTKEQIIKLEAEYKSLLPLAEKDQSRLWKKFRLEWNYNSNHLEGNTLTYGETELLLIFDQTKGNHTKRELDEMQAHDVAIEKVREWAADPRPLSQADIRALNKIILVKPFYKDAQTMSGDATRKRIVPGEYKTLPNNVRLANGEIFAYAAPEEVSPKMQALLDWYKDTEGQDPIEVAARLHYDFVCIHPFDDGNGRVSRLLLNYHLLKVGLPPIVIKSKDKKAYLRALNEADTGNVAAFVDYIREQMLWSLELAIKAAKGESVEESGDWKKKMEVLNKKLEQSEITVQPYSQDTVRNIYLESIFPLFKALDRDVFSLIGEMFLKREVELKVGNMQVQASFNSNTGLNQTLELVPSNHNLEIILRCSFRGFKKNGGHTFDHYESVRVIFSEYNYTLDLPNQNYKRLFTKAYSEMFTDSEIAYIKDQIGETAINFIESQLNNTK